MPGIKQDVLANDLDLSQQAYPFFLFALHPFFLCGPVHRMENIYILVLTLN